MIKSGEHNARESSRARVLLLLDRSQGQKRTIAQVAEAVMMSTAGVSAIKKRYFKGGLAIALYDRARPRRGVIKMTGDVEAQLIALACSEPPDGYERWTLRLLAERLVTLEVVDSLSHVAVGETLKKTNLSLGK